MIPSDATGVDLETAVSRLQAEVAMLRDRQAVHDVYVRYGRGIDRIDEELYRTAFWPDAQINYGTWESITPDRHWERHMLYGHKQNLRGWGHLLTNEVVDIDGDVAHVEIYVTPMWAPKEGAGEALFLSGRYIDRVDRRDGEWRIAVREFIPHFAMKVNTSNYDEMWKIFFPESQPEWLSEPWGKRDTSYVRPLEKRSTEAGPPSAA